MPVTRKPDIGELDQIRLLVPLELYGAWATLRGRRATSMTNYCRDYKAVCREKAGPVTKSV